MALMPLNLIDVREIPPLDRQARILGELDRLPPGGRLVLVSDHEPRPLQALLQVDRVGVFDWSPLEEGPAIWRIEVSRRSREDQLRTVTEYMAWDHDRLDDLLVAAGSACAAGHGPEAGELFGQFRTGLERHIRMEEEILFPAFQAAVGERAGGAGECGPVSVLKKEHEEIRQVLTRMQAAIAHADNAESFEATTAALRDVLGPHNEKEEMILYPMTDREYLPSDRSDLVLRMQRLPGNN